MRYLLFISVILAGCQGMPAPKPLVHGEGIGMLESTLHYERDAHYDGMEFYWVSFSFDF